VTSPIQTITSGATIAYQYVEVYRYREKIGGLRFHSQKYLEQNPANDHWRMVLMTKQTHFRPRDKSLGESRMREEGRLAHDWTLP
jgi:hypothetical protein